VILVADILGVLASLMLVSPALAASSLLRQIARVQAAAPGAGQHLDVGQSLASAMQGQLMRWHAWDHWLLVGGTVLLCLSFLVRLATHAAP
jgi:hypothetical protein